MKVSMGEIVLSDEDARFLREHKALIDQHTAIVSALQSALVNRVRLGYGVDLEREDWELDIDRGILRREPRMYTDVNAQAKAGTGVGMVEDDTTD